MLHRNTEPDFLDIFDTDSDILVLKNQRNDFRFFKFVFKLC